VLRKYIPGAPEFLPYTKELPKDTTSQRVKAKGKGKTKDDVAEGVENLKV
jgi:seryl-tRNA synthetase